MLPQPDEGWRQAVRAYHRDQFVAFAHGHGVPFDEYVNEALTRLRMWAATTRIRIRMDYDTVETFLIDGRYRTQFEIGSSGGAYTPARRTLVEHTAFGIPPGARPQDRPVYGYCKGSNESHPNVIKYGDVVLELRPDVTHRATFTFGDSLDDIAFFSPLPPFCPRPLSRPGTLALNAGRDVLAVGELWQATNCGYIEAQVFGALTARDVATVVYTLKLEPTEAMKEEMANLGINWRTVSGDEP